MLPQEKQGLTQGLARTRVLAMAGAVCVSCCLRSCCSLLFSAFTPLGQLWLRPAAGWNPGRSAAGRLVTCAAACEFLQGTPGMVRPVMQGHHDMANAIPSALSSPCTPLFVIHPRGPHKQAFVMSKMRGRGFTAQPVLCIKVAAAIIGAHSAAHVRGPWSAADGAILTRSHLIRRAYTRQSTTCRRAHMAPQGHEPYQLSCWQTQGSGTAGSPAHTGPQMPATNV